MRLMIFLYSTPSLKRTKASDGIERRAQPRGAASENQFNCFLNSLGDDDNAASLS